MKYIILWSLLTFVAAISSTVMAADINGEWKVEMTNRDPKITRAWYEFKVDGSKLTGSAIGYWEDERPILDGKVNDDKIFFTVKEHAGNRVSEYRYEGKVTGDIIKFKVQIVGAGNRYWTFTAHKVSQ